MNKKFLVVMILCFIFGGYFILNYMTQFQAAYFRPNSSEIGSENITISDNFNESFRRLPRTEVPRFTQLYAPERLIYLLGGIMFIIAGISIWYLVREKEIKILEEKITDTFLLPEEKEIINELKKSGGESTQNELVRKTGYSKVKVHRILNKLESKDMIKRHPYGMTKKVLLKINSHKSKK